MDSLSKSSQVPPSYEGAGDETPEESSWTMYFEDFLNENYNVIDQMNGNSSCFSSDINYYQTSSLVSAAGKHFLGASLDHKLSFKKNRLSFKKRKTNGSSAGIVDDDLEDTASSPVNSPKICHMENHFDKNLKMKEAMEISEKNKGSGSSGRVDDRNDELGFINSSENYDETQLKKRGLCLVPLSMVVQYLG